jgi:hypothetical protein
MWQSLSFGANYKAAYCMSVCPAGEDVIGPWLANRQQHMDDVVRPLQHKEETVYVVAGSDAEEYVPKKFPHKHMKQVGNGIRPQSIAGFVVGMPLAFQRGRSEGLDATYHFTFTGEEARRVTVVIRDRTLEVADGHVGVPDQPYLAGRAGGRRFGGSGPVAAPHPAAGFAPLVAGLRPLLPVLKRPMAKTYGRF